MAMDTLVGKISAHKNVCMCVIRSDTSWHLQGNTEKLFARWHSGKALAKGSSYVRTCSCQWPRVQAHGRAAVRRGIRFLFEKLQLQWRRCPRGACGESLSRRFVPCQQGAGIFFEMTGGRVLTFTYIYVLNLKNIVIVVHPGLPMARAGLGRSRVGLVRSGPVRSVLRVVLTLLHATVISS